MLQNFPPLYAIADCQTCHFRQIDILDFALGFFKGGGKILQYRDKVSDQSDYLRCLKNLVQIAENFENTVVIVNEFIPAIIELGPDFERLWFHFGQEDLRQYQDLLIHESTQIHIGISTHSLAEILTAKKFLSQQHRLSQSYLAFGSVFTSATKPQLEKSDLNETIAEALSDLPHVYIGGITLENFALLPRHKNTCYAVISDFFRFGCLLADIEKYTKSFLQRVAN